LFDDAQGYRSAVADENAKIDVALARTHLDTATKARGNGPWLCAKHQPQQHGGDARFGRIRRRCASALGGPSAFAARQSAATARRRRTQPRSGGGSKLRPIATTTKTSDTAVTGCLFSVSHETDVERVAFWLHRTVAAKQSGRSCAG